MSNNGDFEAARWSVEERCEEAEDLKRYPEFRLLECLYTLASLVCCIADHPDDAESRIDEAGRLVSAALDVRWATLQSLSPPGEEDRPDLKKALRLEKNVDHEIHRVMSAIGHDGTEVRCSDITGLLRALQRLVDWTEEIAATAVPDPAED